MGTISPDALESEIEAQQIVEDTVPVGHVPPANRPGHEHEAPDEVDPERGSGS